MSQISENDQNISIREQIEALGLMMKSFNLADPEFVEWKEKGQYPRYQNMLPYFLFLKVEAFIKQNAARLSLEDIKLVFEMTIEKFEIVISNGTRNVNIVYFVFMAITNQYSHNRFMEVFEVLYKFIFDSLENQLIKIQRSNSSDYNLANISFNPLGMYLSLCDHVGFSNSITPMTEDEKLELFHLNAINDFLIESDRLLSLSPVHIGLPAYRKSENNFSYNTFMRKWLNGECDIDANYRAFFILENPDEFFRDFKRVFFGIPLTLTESEIPIFLDNTTLTIAEKRANDRIDMLAFISILNPIIAFWDVPLDENIEKILGKIQLLLRDDLLMEYLSENDKSKIRDIHRVISNNPSNETFIDNRKEFVEILISIIENIRTNERTNPILR